MSHFYGSLKGGRKEVTRAGHKTTGLSTIAASYSGSIHVRIFYDLNTKQDRFVITQEPWEGKGVREVIAQGILGQPLPQTREEL